MRVTLIKKDKIRSTILPEEISGNFWVTDYDNRGNKVNLISIRALNNKWNLLGNDEVYCMNGNERVPGFVMDNYKFYPIKNIVSNEDMMLYCSPSCDVNLKKFYVNSNTEKVVNIGSELTNNICYKYLEPNHAKLTFENGKFVIVDVSNKYGVYVNNLRVNGKKYLDFGDSIFINGLKIKLYKDETNPKIVICDAEENITTNDLMPSEDTFYDDDFTENEEVEMNWYNEEDYFNKTPRFVNSISAKDVNIDIPPEKEPENDTPVLLTVGPMLTMSMSSMVMAFSSISNMKQTGGSISTILPSIIMSGSMVAGTLLWPTLTRRYEKHKRKKKEKERISKYSKYIDLKTKFIQDEIKNQESILRTNYPSLLECGKIVVNKNPDLWKKRIEDSDFLSVSLGYGSYPMKINIKYPEEHFTMLEDKLKQEADKISRETKLLNNVPVEYSLFDNFISSIVGDYSIRSEYMKKLLFQITTFHSYADLKIIVFTDEDKKHNWDVIKNTPYCFNDDMSIRFFSTNKEEANDLCGYFEKIYNAREERKIDNAHLFDRIYLIVTDSFKLIRSCDFIEKMLENKSNLGFSILISNDTITTLPDQCKNFITLDPKECYLSKNELSSNKQVFKIDNTAIIDYYSCYKILSNIPIEMNGNGETKIPDKVGFLEMYDVGKVDQLNSLNRWRQNDPISSLKAPVGFGKNNELVYIDLHEKYHGPHGLIAGMTGSGKSEFIITYILSMAVNYHPYECQFILIDYKGGGLAGAFENVTAKMKLPHLVGTITNLDATEIKRNLASIESELKRRQRYFNIAREKSGESTIDIYKYQQMYRNHEIDEPISHLFIISDEFAELKTQQPEFMAQLISTARIGRSLGVHLILATQKPSGVVDPQIWSNTRFRVCLRVQDKGDSNEVIKCPDAALLTQTGRFYFQVGYNEIFWLGQSAWAGGKYFPSEKIRKSIDTSIDFINDIGQKYKKVETKPKEIAVKSNGEELLNIVKYLQEIAQKENIKCKPLWLDKMPSYINIIDLINKYSMEKISYLIDIPVGEYDVPKQQAQRLLTVPFSEKGNTLVYGAAGSGKENFIMTLIYSASLRYTPSEINFYIMDFGAEILKMFIKSPYVGDVVQLDDAEKIKNLYKMLNDMIDERKNLFLDYNGSFNTYCKNSGNTIPNVIIILNNFEAYQDTYEEYEDILNVLTRDCAKYGIFFLITCNTPNGMRFKLKQNFSQTFVLQQNNEDDYSSILGNVYKNYPSKIFGRGIIKEDEVYEFQTAMIDKNDDIASTVKNKIDELNQQYSIKAKPIPTLPEVVCYDDVSSALTYDENLVIGIERNSLNIVKYNFRKNYINLVSSLDNSIMDNFNNSLIRQLKLTKNTSITVFNADEYNIEENTKLGIVYDDGNFNDSFDKIFAYIEGCYNYYLQSNYNKSILIGQKRIICVILGLEAFKNKLSEDNKIRLKDLFNKGKDLDIINYIFIDSIDSIKKSEVEQWFKDGINPQDAIWIGNGINDQFTIKVTQRIPELRESIPDDFCFVINRGKPSLVKYVAEFDDK